MKTEESLSKGIIKRIVFIAIVMLLLMGAGVLANVSQMKTVTIKFSDGTELSVLTSKSTVSEILDENNIILLNDEVAVPSADSTIDSSKTISIVSESKLEETVAEEVIDEIVDEDEDVTENETEDSEETVVEEESTVIVSEDIINDSSTTSTIVEKIVVEQEEIPYETVKKEVDVSSDDETTSKVIQKGENGIKEITYKVKYENDIEIERTKISEEVIKEATDKIIQVTKKTTSRSSTRSTTAVSYGNGTWSYSAEEFDLLCAITAQECSSSYSGALAVITTACNRAQSSKWKSYGTDPLSQYKAKGQFCYSIGTSWRKRLNGNYPSCVKQAVTDALNGARNHTYLSFRSASSGHSGVNIGGNVYFNSMN